MEVATVSALKATMPAMLRRLRVGRSPILIVSTGRPQAVLQDVVSYESMQEAIAMLRLMMQSERSIAAGRGSSAKAILARMRARIRSRSAEVVNVCAPLIIAPRASPRTQHRCPCMRTVLISRITLRADRGRVDIAAWDSCASR
jgi:prevent-host-death family protein